MNWRKSKVIIYGGITLALAIYVFVQSLNISPMYLEGATFWCFALTAYVVAGVFLHYGSIFVERINPNPEQEGPYRVVPQLKLPKWAVWVIVIPWGFLLLMNIIMSPLLSYPAYRDQLGVPEVREFTSDVQVMDLDQLPVVDKELAAKLADKKLGERPSLGSQVYLGEPTVQQVKGELVWVVPLQHSGFFKWLTNMEGTPGYIVVSATNPNNVEYVEDYLIKIQPNSYLMHDLARHTRFGGALFKGITDYSFELDNNGQPFWVVSTYKNRRGFALPEATGAILVNAGTGECADYGINDLPSWVDRVQPEDFVMNQINNQGEYVHGIFNFANKDKFQTSEGEMIIYNDGRCYMFTGLTSVGRDESAIGFMMVDMVTKESIRYQISGATEWSAQKSAEGKVQNLRYEASFPLILNVDGVPTYFMTLKDAEGLIKQYAFVSVENYSIVGTGETIREANGDYIQNLRASGSNVMTDAETQQTKTGAVDRIASEFDGIQTVYRLTLQGQGGVIYEVAASVSDQLALTQTGDRVELVYNEGEGTLHCSRFSNLSLK
ncbi:MAG: hypothetical protein IKU72_02680 [Oscillospiraceae bacterium]|nr:hypothetical protein [Oscillospiraceae bacterium]